MTSQPEMMQITVLLIMYLTLQTVLSKYLQTVHCYKAIFDSQVSWKIIFEDISNF